MTPAEYFKMLEKSAAFERRIEVDPAYVYSDEFICDVFHFDIGPLHPGLLPDLSDDVRSAPHLAVDPCRIPDGYDTASYPAYVAMVIGKSIRHVRQKGRGWDAFVSPWRIRLGELVEQGNPAAKVVKDWICGNRAFLTGEVISLIQELPAFAGGEQKLGGRV